MTVYGVAALSLFVSGVAWLLFHWWQERSAESVARHVLAHRRALYTEIPEHRLLSDGELVDERRRLDSTSDALPKLRHVADYVDHYPLESRFHETARKPIRVLADAEGTTVAQVFCTGKGIVRVHLVTELGGGRWLLTENNLNELHIERPEGFRVVRVRNDTSAEEILAKHGEAVAEMRSGNEGLIAVRTFADFVASHERRWGAIRAHRRSIGWVLASEIAFAPGTGKEERERVCREIRRMVAEG